MSQYELELRQQMLEYAKALNNTGLSAGKSGNLSVRCEDGMLITPSGMEYHQLKGEDIVKLNLSGDKLCSSIYSPSTEWHFHAGIYTARPDQRAVVHAHPSYCTALACTSRSIPAFHYMVAIAGGKEIPLASYATFGTEQLSNNIVICMSKLRACLLENHGMLATGESLKQAFQLAQEVELLAQQYCLALTIGNVNLLSDYEMDVVIEKFKTYGRNSSA